MEFTTEINKIFGEEMAKLFANTISEEEMKKKAEKVWTELNQTNTSSWSLRQDSEIENLIKRKILDKVYEKINNILSEPINEEVIEKRAREMVEEARKVGEEAIIKEMARKMVENTLSAYNSHEAIVLEVMNRLRIERNDGRGY